MVSWALFALCFFFLLTGFGITEPGIVGPLTGGLFSKAVSYRLHTLLWGPFLVVLILHLYLSCRVFRS